MTKYRAVALAVVALFSVCFLASPVAAGEMAGVMMKDGKVMMMKDGKATGPMDHEMTMTNGCKVKPDGTMTMKDGTKMRMQEGQMMTMDGKVVEGGKGMEHGRGMKMEGMPK